MSEKLKQVILQISETTTDIEMITGDVICKVNNLVIKENNVIRINKGLLEVEDISGKKIRLVFNNGKEVELPTDIYNNLLLYIRNQGEIMERKKGQIDCNSFVSFVYGIGMGDRTKIFEITDKKYFLSSSDLNPGDIVFLENKNTNKSNIIGNYYFAIYLGNNLCISKFSNQNIGICSLEELESLYLPTHRSKLVKKNTKAS